jgi:hypothetical protein
VAALVAGDTLAALDMTVVQVIMVPKDMMEAKEHHLTSLVLLLDT